MSRHQAPTDIPAELSTNFYWYHTTYERETLFLSYTAIPDAKHRLRLAMNASQGQAANAASLLSELGTRGDMIKKIIMDLDKWCPHGCIIHNTSVAAFVKRYECVSYGIRVVALLRQLWHRPDLDI
jgi:hypothetical protein